MSYLEFLTSVTPNKVSPRASSSLRVVSFNIGAADGVEISPSVIAEIPVRLQARFHVVAIQGVWRDALAEPLSEGFRKAGYHLLTGAVSQSAKHSSKLLIPGLFFASLLPIVKWEFERISPVDPAAPPQTSQPASPHSGLLSVCVNYKQQHLWLFSPLLTDSHKAKSPSPTLPITVPQSLEHANRTSKIMMSKLWFSEDSFAPKSLSYGSVFQILFGTRGALYEKKTLQIGAGVNVRDRVQKFRITRVNGTVPLKHVCYHDSVLLQTHTAMFLHASEQMVYHSAAEPRGIRSSFTLVDPRRPESKAVVNHKDQFILKDGFGTFVAVQSGGLVAGVTRLEDATLFQLDVIASVPSEVRPGESLVTTGSQVIVQDLETDENHEHYLSVDVSGRARWHLHTEAIEAGQMETFEVVNPVNYLDCVPVCDEDCIYLRATTGHYLSLDPKSGWIFAESKRADNYSLLCFTKDSGIRALDNSKKKKNRDPRRGSFSLPFNVEHRFQVNMNFEWKGFQKGETPDQVFKIHEELGRGSYGSVYRANHVDGFELAIKEIKIESTEDIQNEIEILKMCSHKNVVSYFGSLIKGGEYLWILMEYMPLGSIKDLIDKRKSPLTEAEIAYVSAHTLHGMNYLHSRGIIHRDVKAANILLNDTADIKLADFGVSGYFGSVAMKKETVGTPLWMAPEVLRRNPASQSSDIWSMGVTVIEMADGKPPNHDISVLRAMRLTVDPDTPPPTFATPTKFSANLLDFLGHLLVKSPIKRPSAYQFLSHPFLQGILNDTRLRQQMLATCLLLRSGKTDLVVPDSPSIKGDRSPNPPRPANSLLVEPKEKGSRSRQNSDTPPPKFPSGDGATTTPVADESSKPKSPAWFPVRMGSRRGSASEGSGPSHTTHQRPIMGSSSSPKNEPEVPPKIEVSSTELGSRSRSGSKPTPYMSRFLPRSTFSKRWDKIDYSDPAFDAWVYAFGMNSRNQLGFDHFEDEMIPAPLSRFEHSPEVFACGGHHTLFVGQQGLFGSGDNTHGQLGLGPSFVGKLSLPPTLNVFFEERQIDRIVCGLFHSMVLLRPNKLYAFGKNSSGQLGVENTSHQHSPQIVIMPTRSEITGIACGSDHTLICTRDGRLFGMGSDDFGQLGHGPLKTESGRKIYTKPTQVAFLGDKHIDGVYACANFSIVKTRDGQLFSFGDNSCGQLGLSSVATYERPQFISAFADEPVSQVACGSHHALVLTEDGQLYSFGKNTEGQLGLGDVDDRNSPTLMFYFANKKVVELSCGANHSLVLCDDGQVFAFGNNLNGQLGLSNDHHQPTPQVIPIFLLRPAISVACGYAFSVVHVTSKSAMADTKLKRPRAVAPSLEARTSALKSALGNMRERNSSSDSQGTRSSQDSGSTPSSQGVTVSQESPSPAKRAERPRTSSDPPPNQSFSITLPQHRSSSPVVLSASTPPNDGRNSPSKPAILAPPPLATIQGSPSTTVSNPFPSPTSTTVFLDSDGDAKEPEPLSGTTVIRAESDDEDGPKHDSSGFSTTVLNFDDLSGSDEEELSSGQSSKFGTTVWKENKDDDLIEDNDDQERYQSPLRQRHGRTSSPEPPRSEDSSNSLSMNSSSESLVRFPQGPGGPRISNASDPGPETRDISPLKGSVSAPTLQGTTVINFPSDDEDEEDEELVRIEVERARGLKGRSHFVADTSAPTIPKALPPLPNPPLSESAPPPHSTSAPSLFLEPNLAKSDSGGRINRKSRHRVLPFRADAEEIAKLHEAVEQQLSASTSPPQNHFHSQSQGLPFSPSGRSTPNSAETPKRSFSWNRRSTELSKSVPKDGSRKSRSNKGLENMNLSEFITWLDQASPEEAKPATKSPDEMSLLEFINWSENLPKDAKEPKDKESRDTKDPKDNKDPRDKDPKDRSKEGKDSKDKDREGKRKDSAPKEERKDRSDSKDSKDSKDLKDSKASKDKKRGVLQPLASLLSGGKDKDEDKEHKRREKKLEKGRRLRNMSHSSSLSDEETDATIPLGVNEPLIQVKAKSIVPLVSGMKVILKIGDNPKYALPMYKALGSALPFYALRCAQGLKKVKGKSAVFKITLVRPGPVRMKPTEKLGALVLGDFGRGFDLADYRQLRANLSEPRDCWLEKHQLQEKGLTFVPVDKPGSRMNFVFTFDSVPCFAANKLLRFDVVECTLLTDFADLKVFLHLPVAVTLACEELA